MEPSTNDRSTHDRRTKQRFPIQLDAQYTLYQRSNSTTLGVGKTIDIGSGGLRFQADQELPAGTRIEISMSWPVLMHGTCAMTWVVLGNVVRTFRGVTACTIERCQFKTCGRNFPIPTLPITSNAKRLIKPRAIKVMTAGQY